MERIPEAQHHVRWQTAIFWKKDDDSRIYTGALLVRDIAHQMSAFKTGPVAFRLRHQYIENGYFTGRKDEYMVWVELDEIKV